MAGPEGLDPAALALKYRRKGQDDTRVYNTLRSLGYSKTEATAAVKTLPASPASTSATPNGGRSLMGLFGGKGTATPTPTPAAPATSGPSMPAAPDLSKLSLTPPRKVSGGDLGGFLAGLVVYALVLSFITEGADGPKSWLMAKFINQPTAAPAGKAGRLKKSADTGSGGGGGEVVTTVAARQTSTGLTSTRPTLAREVE